uniref:Uncharacterized protein n=1 Tax=Solanum lycopersicum TaxID=4081 RepID=A0A3Q7H896_SOLLC
MGRFCRNWGIEGGMETREINNVTQKERVFLLEFCEKSVIKNPLSGKRRKAGQSLPRRQGSFAG